MRHHYGAATGLLLAVILVIIAVVTAPLMCSISISARISIGIGSQSWANTRAASCTADSDRVRVCFWLGCSLRAACGARTVPCCLSLRSCS